MTIAQRNSKQNQNKLAAQNRAKAMAKDNIQKFGGTAKAAAANKQAMRDKIKVQNNPTQGKPMASNPQGMRQQGVGKSANDLSRHSTGSSAAQKPAAKPGLLSRIGSGIKRVAGGVADAATGNKFDFDKRGGQRPAPQAARGGNVRGSGARNRPMQSQPDQNVPQSKPVPQGGGQAKVAAPVSKAVPTGSGGVRTSRPAPQKPQAQQSSGGGASASRKIDGAGLANTMRAQNNQSGGQRRPVSPIMQQKLNRIGAGTRAAQAVQKANPQPGQTVTTRQNAQGGTTATLTSSAGSLQKNKQKANRVANAMNKSGQGNVSVGKIDDF